MKTKLTFFAAVSVALFSFDSSAANHDIANLSELSTSFYTVGDTLTLPAGSYTTVGDGVATVVNNVVTCKKAGFTLVNDGSSDHRLCIVPEAPAGGDVFYWFSNNGNGEDWTSVGWTKVTQNTDRTYPNNANDIAVVEGGCTWAKMLINDDISLHGYVVGVPKNGTGTVRVQLETANKKTLTFCGSETDPAFFNFSSMYTGDCGVRLGTEKGTGDKVLTVNVAAKRMNFDWCGDSAAVSSPRRGKAEIQWCSAIVNVPEGNTLAFVNDSKAVTDSIFAGNTSVGHIAGSGTVVFEQSGGIATSLLTFADGAFAGDIAVRSADWKGMAEFPGADLTVFDAPNAGRKMLAIGYDNCSSNPGRSQIDVKSVTLDGGCVRIYRNYADGGNLTPWTEGATTDEEKAARLTVTNEIKKLLVKGDSAFYCELSYGTTRVRQHLVLDEIEHDTTGTLCLYDFNFRDKDSRKDPLHYDRVRGEGLAAHAAGRDPQPGDSQFVYKIIPWIACTANDNNFATYSSWGSDMTFPALTNGVHGLALISKGRTNLALQNAGEWDNVYFSQKGIGTRGTGLSADVTINSLAYNTGETAPYPDNFILGEGRTLTIKSGGLIMARSGRWLGCTQTTYFPKNGTVAFGNRAYVISDYGVPNGDTGNEYNAIWSKMLAPNGLTKGGCGELVFAADQRGIDGDIAIGGGTLWLGHPANYRKLGWLYSQQAANSATIPVRGCVTDVGEFTLRPGAVLGIPSKGYDVDGNGEIGSDETALSATAVIRLEDNAAGTAKVESAEGADQICAGLYINGQAMAGGTYGASGSGADIIDDLHFAGPGTLTVGEPVPESQGIFIFFE